MPGTQPTALLVLASILILGGCPDALPSAQLRNASRRPAFPFLPAEEAWLTTLPASPAAPGVMDDRRVYVPLQVGEDAPSAPGLVALDRESGSVEWTSGTQTQSLWPLVVGDGSIFLCVGNEVQALEPATGRLKWRTSLSGLPTAPMAVGGTVILVVIQPATIAALRATDGEILWSQPLGSPSQMAPAIRGQDAAYVSLDDGRVLALALPTGATLWERQLGGTLTAPAVARDRVLVGSTDNVFYALDSDRGETAWKWRAGGDVVGSVARDDSVFFVALDNVIRSVNRGNGNQRWKQPVTTRPVAPPRVFGGSVFVSGISPAFSTFEARTGVATGTYAATGELLGPVLVDPAPHPFRVGMVVLLRDGRAIGLRPTEMMFREAPPEPPAALLGRPLARERLP